MKITSRELFLNACSCKKTVRVPIWFMRQAGRCLPEYRKLRKKYSFMDLVKSPELAAEVTLQPVKRFGFDAAIIFSDILVIPEALGFPYKFDDRKGMKITRQIHSLKDIERIDPNSVEKIEYVASAIKLAKNELKDNTALLGFCGSPWTLACYMLEGGGSNDFFTTRRIIRDDKKFIDKLLSKISAALVRFLNLQISAGVDAVQIFDSLGGILPPHCFDEMSGRWMRRVIHSLKKKVPVIVFSRGIHDNWNSLINTEANVIGIDWNISIDSARQMLPSSIAIQGNLDPALLLASPQKAREETKKILSSMKERNGFIFNLGHGVPPSARLDTMESVIDTVRSFK
ncbi:TPA: uroporphyrinogen decarboxylase [bacterium]|nr:MAG: uroporphyrinogen decarboxylase [Candidatus Hydrogenedentes bacterium CG1_02_42_14]PIU47735.1 MAG: uroporphyrinogen decarboxylase [Candidatus Hydrogenedentes bacterium CG07_land_8_20_14_0_80_42_17]HBW46920.1 uroporphyrinogen decarboxylase [bacterium]